MNGAGVGGESIERTTNRYRGHHHPRRVDYRSAHRSNPCLAFANRGQPALGTYLPRQYSPTRSLVEGKGLPGAHDRSESVGTLERSDAHSRNSVTHIELGRLSREIPKGRESRGGRRGERPTVGGRPTQGENPRAEGVATVAVTTQQIVGFQGGCQPMGGRPAESGALHQTAEGEGTGFDGGENCDRLVDHADTTYDRFHNSESMSHIVRWQETTGDGFHMTNPRTLSEKIWDRHVVTPGVNGGPDLLYVDLHLVHEVTSPQAFDGLRISGRSVRRPDLTIATEDHNVPTEDIHLPIADEVSRKQVDTLRVNTEEFGITNFRMGDPKQGIVHVIGPEQGLTQPGMTIVCGDSHTATHGAFGSIAFGIGTSEVEHVLATQTLPQARPGTMAITVDGQLPEGSTAKDVILAIIGRIGTGGGIGKVIEYRGEVIRALSMEGRMTVCNMSIEGGAKAGLIAPDETTVRYLEGREHSPRGADWDAAVADWLTLPTDEGATFDEEVVLDGAEITPHVSWGTNPAQVMPISGLIPSPDSFADPAMRDTAARALEYMDFTAGTPIRDVKVDTVFIGSCTNSRIEDLRAAAEVVKGRLVAAGMRTLVVPGSGPVKAQAEAEGLPEVFTAAGFDWREPGCSMCLAMNPDKLQPGERAASTSNRNFEGRQGRGGRTHLVSPAVAAATAIAGTFATPADLG